MNDSHRARPGSSGSWDRARRAYVALLGADDPMASVVADPRVLDLRPAGLDTKSSESSVGPIVVSGADDLRELRAVVERAIGVGTWPAPAGVDGPVHTATLGPGRAAAMLHLLASMDGLIDTRSPWGTWRHTVDTLAGAVAEIQTLSLSAHFLPAEHRSGP